jgi:8-oxo-dGTP diphosphatase
VAAPEPVIVVAAAIIRQAGRILLVQRPATAALGGLWEFPGGKLEPGETPEAALARELVEELDITVTIGPLYHTTDHAYPGGPTVRLLFYPCALVTGPPRLLWGQALAWVAPADLVAYATPAADQPVIARLIDGR